MRALGFLGVASVLVGSLLLGDALAQTPPTDPVTTAKARELARRGRAAYDTGDFAKGCPLLDEAYRLDGNLLGAGFALAECREKEGKLATAHRTFIEIALKAKERGEERAVEAKARADALAPRVPRLRVDVSEQAAAIAELEITVDGNAWPRAAWGVAEPLDGGTHEVAARAPGQEPWSVRVDAAEGKTVEAQLPYARPAAAAVAPPPLPTPPPEEPATSSGFPWRTAGIVTAGVGVACVGLGVVLGLSAKSSYDDAAGCSEANICTPGGAQERNDARGLADVGTVFFIAGGVLAAGGVTVFLLAPSGDATAAALRVAPGGVTMDGRF